MTNTEFVQWVMETGGRTGALRQMVIMQAIPEYCKQIVNGKENLLKQYEEDEKNGKRSIIHIPAWIEAAEEIIEMFNKRGNGKEIS